MTAANKRGSIRIEAHRGCRPYNKQVFGQFIEHFHRQIYGGIFEPDSPLSDELGFRVDVMEAIRELRVPIVRWPGGCFVSAYHWDDGIGPERKPAFDKAWSVEDPNTFGTDEFVTWCREIGAEPYICTNAGSGSEEEMSNWVEYCNGTLGKWAHRRVANGYEQPHNVRYWSVGNENYGAWEIGAKTGEQWGPYVAESAKMMLRSDPSIKLTAAAVPSIDWTLPLLQHAGKYLSYVSIHKYWDQLWLKNEPADYATCMLASTDPENVIRMTKSIIHVTGLEDEVKIAFDEWNLRSWHHPVRKGNHEGILFADITARDKNDINATYTMADAIFSACFLNACLRHSDSVGMACMAPIVNTRGSIYAHPEGIVKRTTYHTMWMYANLLEKNIANVWTESEPFEHNQSRYPSLDPAVPALDAIATCDTLMQKWRIVLVNRHPKEGLACGLKLDGLELKGTINATVLTADSPDAFNDTDNLNRVVPIQERLPVVGGKVTLPPHSVTILALGE